MEYIEQIFDYLHEYNLPSVALRLVLCIIVGGMIGMERGRRGRAAGLRTHILVCLGSAMAALVGIFTTENLELSTDASRIAAQVISGIGFLGAGTIIIKGRFRVSGLTTAAGLWATAAIGLALGYGFYEGALIAAVLTGMTITVLSRLETRLYRKTERLSLYMELDLVTAVHDSAAMLVRNYGAMDIQVTPPRSGVANHVGLEATVYLGVLKISEQSLFDELRQNPNVVFVLESV